ncbi:MAG: glycerophosphodiester phosphodiesterase family protein [Candidatus Hydrogenedentes bacterium]|nr:glycerophosphodiester phosphodiesterase family protein [Candidatus Hydrogenedentota bacterium]
MAALVLSLLLVLAQPHSPLLTREPGQGGVYVIAHRGVHEGIPENTLAAYRRAIELGADFVEIDLRETKDGHLVSIHNATVDAYTKDAEGPVKSFTLAELKALDIGSRIGEEWAEERVPSFEEILQLCKGKIGIYLDLKQGDVEEILTLIRHYKMEKDVIWYAGARPLRQLRKQCPQCLPMPEIGAGENLPRILGMYTPEVAASTWKYVSEQLVKSCHAADILLIVDDDGPDTWEDMLAWGVDGIQTDHAALLIERLKRFKGSSATDNYRQRQKEKR